MQPGKAISFPGPVNPKPNKNKFPNIIEMWYNVKDYKTPWAAWESRITCASNKGRGAGPDRSHTPLLYLDHIF